MTQRFTMRGVLPAAIKFLTMLRRRQTDQGRPMLTGTIASKLLLWLDANYTVNELTEIIQEREAKDGKS